MGPSIKYVTLQEERGSEKVWQFVTGVKIMWRHTPFFHNSQFYVLFYILSCIIQIFKFKLQLSPSELWEIKLVREFHGLLETPNIWSLLLFKI